LIKILFLTIGNREPSARFRVNPYIPMLKKTGWHCTVWHQWPSYGNRLFAEGRSLNARVYQMLGMSIALPRILVAGNFDLVFLQRRLPGLLYPPFLERILKRTGHRFVFDFDDAIYLGSRAELSFREIIHFSDQIIAGNSYLASIADLPSKTTVIPTPIDTERFKPSSNGIFSNKNSLVIGWTGTVANYRYLYPLASTLKKIVERFPNTIIKLICDKPPDQGLLSGLKVRFVPWQANIEVEQLQDIDIGIMYLPDNSFTRGKCGFKLIQYMSLAKPVVASPVSANMEIINHGGNGYLAATMEEWYEYLTSLIGNEQLRTTMGYEARRTIEERFSVYSCFPKLEAVFRRALI
jgi:glycosyltransferase involved in cell wall biosynthesis